MMHVAVVTVGDELLAGEVTDTNAAWLCDRLEACGATVRRVVTVPDEVDAIAETVGELAARYDAVVVTGGVGPTHDDRTLAGVAAAFDRELRTHDGAREWLESTGDYAFAELAEGTADLPEGSRFLRNPVGVAPGAVVENVYVLPGVPAEMEAMFDHVAAEFDGAVTHVETLEAAEPESALVDRIAEAEDRFDVAVGSYPGEVVRLSVRSTDPTAAAEAADWLRERVAQR